jgi:hypothetical protein
MVVDIELLSNTSYIFESLKNRQPELVYLSFVWLCLWLITSRKWIYTVSRNLSHWWYNTAFYVVLRQYIRGQERKLLTKVCYYRLGEVQHGQERELSAKRCSHLSLDNQQYVKLPLFIGRPKYNEERKNVTIKP